MWIIVLLNINIEILDKWFGWSQAWITSMTQLQRRYVKRDTAVKTDDIRQWAAICQIFITRRTTGVSLVYFVADSVVVVLVTLCNGYFGNVSRNWWSIIIIKLHFIFFKFLIIAKWMELCRLDRQILWSKSMYFFISLPTVFELLFLIIFKEQVGQSLINIKPMFPNSHLFLVVRELY